MNIALYPRVSTHEQFENGYSLEEQIDRMKKYCEAMGWTVYKIYTDAGCSGANMDRPALQAMIKDIKAGKIDKVLVYKLDRLSRSQKDTLTLIEDVFLAHDCDFVSMTENLDTSTPFGKAMIGILAVFAQLEREQIKERMSMGRVARAKSGKYHGSDTIPVGYDYVDGELIINEYEAMLVKTIFEMYSEGVSPYKITDSLNDSGQTPRDRVWLVPSVRVLLKNKTYAGYVPFSGEWYKGNHVPIISEELFDKVQEVRARKAEVHKKYNRRAGKVTSYLGGYLYCKRCGAKYSKVSTRYKPRNIDTIKRYEYYTCNSVIKKSPYLVHDPNCDNPNRHMSELDNEVFEEIKKLALDPNYFENVKSEKIEDERPKVLKEKIKEIEDQLARLMDLYTIGQLPMDMLQDKAKVLGTQKEKLTHELEDIEKEEKEMLSHDETMKLAQSFSDILDRGDFDEIRTVIGSLIDKIEIDGDITTIHWSFA